MKFFLGIIASISFLSTATFAEHSCSCFCVIRDRSNPEKMLANCVEPDPIFTLPDDVPCNAHANEGGGHLGEPCMCPLKDEFQSKLRYGYLEVCRDTIALP